MPQQCREKFDVKVLGKACMYAQFLSLMQYLICYLSFNRDRLPYDGDCQPKLLPDNLL